jgi:hypothetical protein
MLLVETSNGEEALMTKVIRLVTIGEKKSEKNKKTKKQKKNLRS